MLSAAQSRPSQPSGRADQSGDSDGDAAISAGVMAVELLLDLGGMIQDIDEMVVLCRELSQL
jgi:hypothetical protein